MNLDTHFLCAIINSEKTELNVHPKQIKFYYFASILYLLYE